MYSVKNVEIYLSSNIDNCIGVQNDKGTLMTYENNIITIIIIINVVFIYWCFMICKI